MLKHSYWSRKWQNRLIFLLWKITWTEEPCGITVHEVAVAAAANSLSCTQLSTHTDTNIVTANISSVIFVAILVSFIPIYI